MNILRYLSLHYDLTGVMLIAELAALMVSIRHYRRHPSLRIFSFYLFFSILQMAADFYAVNGDHGQNKMRSMIFGAYTNIFMLFEYSVCIYIIIRHIPSKGRRWVIYIDSLLFALLLGITTVRKPQLLFQPVFFLYECFFLLLPCLLFFFEFFLKPHQGRLKDLPSFWVITGFLFLNATSIPMIMALGLLGQSNDPVVTVNYILYIALCFFLIRAYYCPPARSVTPAAGR